MAGLGIVARNDQGEVCLSVMANVMNVKNPLHAEVMAILFGVKMMFEHGWLNIIVESDYKTAISLIKGDISNYWEEGVWIEDIIGYLIDLNPSLSIL